ncbi:MAG: D-allose ABC transporter permease [Peptoniphilaceae bacterium]|nr:D-allose ABC transporter permease [Peptoniphilaceae bacterium]MDY6086218.1 D-allose ABC transporter permease [Peptoniphilaceae bacterium]
MEQKKEKKQLSFTYLWSKYSTLFILVLIVIVFGTLSGSTFLTGRNLITITEQSAIYILLACGEFFAILLGGIDLSVGSIMALTGVISAQLMVGGIHPVFAVLIGIVLAGLVLGAVNGSLINLTGLPPFIITLGTQSIVRGITYIISDARAVAGIPNGFQTAIGGKILGIIPIPVIIALVVATILIIFTTRMKAGRNLYALGGNPRSAFFAGITVHRHQLLAFMISGLCAGLAGMVNVARLGAAEPNAGMGFDTFAIAAVIIGGTSFFGGQGDIYKVVIGGLIIGAINNGLNMMGLSAYYQQIAMGALIIVAVTLDRFFGASRKNA